MKHAKIYVALVMITVIATNVRGQVQWSIGDQWVYELRTYSPPTLLSQENYIVQITKDSVINAQSYLVVEAARPLTCGILKSREYIRQDGNQIYRLNYDLSEEHLMIDFDARDSYEIVSDLGPNNRRIVCQAIVQENSSTTFISGQTVRTQNLHLLNNMSYNDETLYQVHEGIGFLSPGFLFPDVGTGLCDPHAIAEIYKCAIIGGDTIQFTDTPCFDFEVISSTYAPNKPILIAYPNPTTDLVQIDSQFEIEKIVDRAGKTVDADIEGHIASLKGLRAGEYYLISKATTEGQIYSIAIIKVD